MVKAVFVDYTGTVVKEGGPEMEEVVARICCGSDLHDPQQAVALWWSLVKQYEESCCGETYMTEDAIVDRILGELEKRIGLRENAQELHELIRGFWVNAPLFADAGAFFAHCPLPIYLLSNNGAEYVGQSMRNKDLHPSGIVCADMVRAYKPHRAIFDKALELSGCRPEEAVHIGDSYTSDVQGARTAGIRPILVQRKTGKTYADIAVVRDLTEALPLLAQQQE